MCLVPLSTPYVMCLVPLSSLKLLGLELLRGSPQEREREIKRKTKSAHARAPPFWAGRCHFKSMCVRCP